MTGAAPANTSAAGGCGGRCGNFMEVFDALPHSVRACLNYSPLKRCACDVAQRLAERGLRAIVDELLADARFIRDPARGPETQKAGPGALG